MCSIRMSWLLIFTLSFLFNHLSEARQEKQISAVVVGTVYCDTCFQQDFSKTSHFISDASVAVECSDGSSKSSFHKEVKTNKHGEFEVHLPFTVSKHVKRIRRCSVKLVSSSEPFCAVAATATSSSLHLKSRKQGIHIFSAGFFTFKPLKQPELCNQKPSLEALKEFSSKKTFLPQDLSTIPPVTENPLPTQPLTPLTPITQNPAIPLLPPLSPLPELPPLPVTPLLPPLPPLPAQPKLSSLSKESTQPKTTELSSKTTLSDKKVDHPNSFFNPPSIPLLPSPSPPFGLPLPPNPFQPPPPLINLPPIPGLTPPPSQTPPFGLPLPPFPGLTPPSPPPPPPFGLPLPPIPGLTPPTLPIPFPPPLSPGFPGIPPVSSSKKTSP